MSSDQAILAEIDAAFGDVPRPEHFTNYTHCCECAEHDELLRSRNRETLSIEDVGNPGWDPLCFCSAEGIAYYFPALARLALADPPYGFGWYGEQLLFHLYSGFRENSFFRFCSAAQRSAVARFLEHIIETRTEAIDEGASDHDFLRCHELWSDAETSTERIP
jgi:hypothetical protein